MRTSVLFSLAAGFFTSTVAAQNTLGAFSDPVNFTLHHTKGDKTHFETIIGDNQVTERTADKTARGIYLISGINQMITFEWSPDTSRVPIQEVRRYYAVPPRSLT